MDRFLKKSWMYIALIFGLGIGFLAIRTSMDAETGREIAGAMSSIPFSDGIYGFLRLFIPMDPAMFPIDDRRFFLVSLLILLIQAAIQAPLMLVVNNAFGPILFRSNGNEYSIIGDPSPNRAKDKLISKLLRLLALVIIIPLIAFFSGWLCDLAFGWINSHGIVLRIIIYAVIVACLVGLAYIPIHFVGARTAYWAIAASAVQSVIYVFITNMMIIAVVGILVSGVSGWHFMFALLALAVWMVIYSDTDGFLMRFHVARR